MNNTNQITCVVKGDRIQTAHAADDRGIFFHCTGGKDGETFGTVHNSQFDRVVKWFCEENNRQGDSLYPVGTLLFYSESKNN